jgi:stage IV sporulation protein A
MDNFNVYKDIQARTKGEIYIGVVGPVRTGKSTFIKRFMDLMVLPNIEDEHSKARTRDELPQSATGTTIMTTEPKFIPKEAADINITDDVEVKVRLIDCVGYIVDGASGIEEDSKERMVKTPWFDHEIPFTQAAEMGTKKVINDHSTIGIVVTCDGSFTNIPRENYQPAEEKTILELKKLGKPFVILLNSERPFSDETVELAEEMQFTYGVSTIPVNCEQLRKDDITKIMERILYEFPVAQLEFYVPKWVEMLPADHSIKQELIKYIKELMKEVTSIRDITNDALDLSCDFVKKIKLDKIELSAGIAKVIIDIEDQYYYDMISEMTGVDITGEYQLMATIRELAKMKGEYTKVQSALESVRARGYGVVTPEHDEIKIEDPMVIKQGNKFGVKIKSESPSIHMIRANIETEIAPIVGSEQQAEDLITYIKASSKTDDGIWHTNIFGKSIEQLVDDGIRGKIAQISDESQVKLQETMQKIVNDSNGGLVCIII